MRIVLFCLPYPGEVHLRALLADNEEVAAVFTTSYDGWSDEMRRQLRQALFVPHELEDPVFLNRVRELKPDIVLTTSFPNLLPKSLLDIPRLGCLNVHQSLLPKYRGANPFFWPIMNREEESGVTIHHMDEGYDTGDIILQRALPITPTETMGSLFANANELGNVLIREVLQALKTGRPLPREPQPKGEFPKAPAVKDADVTIDFRKRTVDILRLLRAANPHYGGLTFFRGNPLRIFAAKETSRNLDLASASPGEIVGFTEADEILIRTGDGLMSPKIVFTNSYFTGESFVDTYEIKTGERFS